MASHVTEETAFDPFRAEELASNFDRTVSKIKTANTAQRNIRLLAVSKVKPASDILALASRPGTYSSLDHTQDNDQAQHPYLHFGEDYAQELLYKAGILPKNIRWHFIGPLQLDRCKQLAEQIPNLWAVETVDTVEKADALEEGPKALINKIDKSSSNEASSGADLQPVRIYIQVNTSGETHSSDVKLQGAIKLAKYIIGNCPNLKLQGLMVTGTEKDFVSLKDIRDKVANRLGWESGELELSMGTNTNFRHAIHHGTDQISLSIAIFGETFRRKVAQDCYDFIDDENNVVKLTQARITRRYLKDSPGLGPVRATIEAWRAVFQHNHPCYKKYGSKTSFRLSVERLIDGLETGELDSE